MTRKPSPEQCRILEVVAEGEKGRWDWVATHAKLVLDPGELLCFPLIRTASYFAECQCGEKGYCLLYGEWQSSIAFQ